MLNVPSVAIGVVCGLVLVGLFSPQFQEAWQKGYLEGREASLSAAKNRLSEQETPSMDGSESASKEQNVEQEALREAERKAEEARAAEDTRRVEQEASEQKIRRLEAQLMSRFADVRQAREDSLRAQGKIDELTERVQSIEREKESAEREASEAALQGKRQKDAQENPKRVEPQHYGDDCSRRSGRFFQRFGRFFRIFSCSR
jgi:hypothetical protein